MEVTRPNEACDVLDSARDRLRVLSMMFATATDADLNACSNGLSDIVEGVIDDMADVYEYLNALRKEA